MPTGSVAIGGKPGERPCLPVRVSSPVTTAIVSAFGDLGAWQAIMRGVPAAP
jgi:hypothetical protein